MKQAILVGWIVLLALVSAGAQKYDYVWRHGLYNPSTPGTSNFLIDFNSFPPSITDAPTDVYVDASGINISHKAGSTAFYSNGCSLFTKLGNVMEGGGVLNPGAVFDVYCKNSTYPIAHGMFALSVMDSVYEVFHLRQVLPVVISDLRCVTPDLLLTRIDMKENDGQGAAVESNKEILHGCFQLAGANLHANGRDWWVLLGGNTSDTFYRLLLTPNGIKGTWIQDIPNLTRDTFEFYGSTGFSPDGSKYFINHTRIGLSIYDFDRCTGLLSNIQFLPKTTFSADLGTAFSSNSRYLYATTENGEKIEQYDLTSSDIFASKQVIAVWDGTRDELNTPIKFTWMQYGPDEKIYIWGWDTRYMHTIEQPNRPGLECKFVQRAIQLPSKAFGANFYYPHYRLGPLDGSSCDTLGLNNLPHAEYRYDLSDSTQALALQFTDVSWYEPTVWHWDFGDPASGSSNASTEQNPVHTFSKPGTYEVCLIVSNAYAADTICREVKVGISSAYTLPALPQAQVQPNPVTDALTVRLPALLPGHPLRFALTDAYGRTVREVLLSDFETEVDVAGLPAGMYFWQVSARGEVLQAGKVVKM